MQGFAVCLYFLSFPDHLLCLYVCACVCEGDEGRTAGWTAGRRLFSGEDGGSGQEQEEGRRFRRQDQVMAARSFPGLPHFFYLKKKEKNKWKEKNWACVELVIFMK